MYIDVFNKILWKCSEKIFHRRLPWIHAVAVVGVATETRACQNCVLRALQTWPRPRSPPSRSCSGGRGRRSSPGSTATPPPAPGTPSPCSRWSCSRASWAASPSPSGSSCSPPTGPASRPRSPGWILCSRVKCWVVMERKGHRCSWHT